MIGECPAGINCGKKMRHKHPIFGIQYVAEHSFKNQLLADGAWQAACIKGLTWTKQKLKAEPA